MNNKFNKITISFASSKSILKESYGEVLKPETINYRTHKPEKDGLFCEKIFGPVKDYECSCGKYKRVRYKGTICEKCGVEIIEKRVRRKRMGHIKLVVPVVHIWTFRCLPNKISYLYGISSRKVEMMIYYERYVVIQPGIAKYPNGLPVKELDFLTEIRYLNILNNLPKENQYLNDNDPNKFIAKMGSKCLKELLKRLDINSLYFKLKNKTYSNIFKQNRIEALKRLQVVQSFREGFKNGSKFENMIIEVLPVIPPELRPLVPLDGGRYASSDLNDFYRKIIIRNNRLKRLKNINAPDVIIRNEKRMLQEAVDSLFDNSRKIYSVKSESNRVLKSLSDSLKGKQGRFRQNLLGKRVDYSARSVIVVGPELKLHECGLPKGIIIELYKPFFLRKLLERGIINNLKDGKKILDERDPVIWDIAEFLLKEYPILLNRAPTLHSLGIQAFQPKIIEGKAIQLHPLVCAAFNADFDGDQMAVHLPLSHEAILEAKILMLSSQNILNPANGFPITIPSQDMLLGLYYITKELRYSKIIKGKVFIFSDLDEVKEAYDHQVINIHEKIKLRIQHNSYNRGKIIDTTVGRALFNRVVPKEIGYINKLLTKKILIKIINKVLNITNFSTTAKFLDKIKEIGFYNAFKGGLSFLLEDIKIPIIKNKLIKKTIQNIRIINHNYTLGIITNSERYNKIIDQWSDINIKITNKLMNNIKKDKNGFNSIFMMLNSGARGSKEQIRQLSGMRGLMAKPQKTGDINYEIIETPIISNFKEGLSNLEYFISTHGSRKGLADTALKTADAGYLTRRLVDSAQDVIIKEKDCFSLRGINFFYFKKNREFEENFYSRILGRVSLNNIYHPNDKNKIIIHTNEIINKKIAKLIKKLKISKITVRSPITCDSTYGICAMCYGINLSTGRISQVGQAVGVIAAQSIGEPGTQLTLRTFHVGGTAGKIFEYSQIKALFDGIIEFNNIKFVESFDKEKNKIYIVISVSAEIILIDINNSSIFMKKNIPYGAYLYVKNGNFIKKEDVICTWDPYNFIIVSELDGIIKYENLKKGKNYNIEINDQTGLKEILITETRYKKNIPLLKILNKEKKVLKKYYLSLGSYLNVKNGQKIKKGEIIIKSPSKLYKSGDITGGLPRLSELFEVRNSFNPAIISEINGIISYGKLIKGNREIYIEYKNGKIIKYFIKVLNKINTQENNYIKAGMPLSEGEVILNDILYIKGSKYVQNILINEIQKVYQLQGVKINNKHFEIIINQMMSKVEILDSGDTNFLEGNIEHKEDFFKENDRIFYMKFIINEGDSKKFKKNQVIDYYKIYYENFLLKKKNKKLIITRNTRPAIAKLVLQGITKSALYTKSFISAASFQETTKVLSEAAISKKTDYLKGLKENVIVGHKIPAGTGFVEDKKIIVKKRKIDLEEISCNK